MSTKIAYVERSRSNGRGRPRQYNYNNTTVSISTRVPFHVYRELKKRGRISDIIIDSLICYFGSKDPISRSLLSYRRELATGDENDSTT